MDALNVPDEVESLEPYVSPEGVKLHPRLMALTQSEATRALVENRIERGVCINDGRPPHAEMTLDDGSKVRVCIRCFIARPRSMAIPRRRQGKKTRSMR